MRKYVKKKVNKSQVELLPLVEETEDRDPGWLAKCLKGF